MQCTKCKLEKDSSFFTKAGKGRIHKQCKTCRSIYIKNHYEQNKAKIIARSKISNIKIRKELTKFYIESKNKPCIDCGSEYPHYCMDFDHMPGFIKKDDVANLIRNGSKRLLEEEIAKCELVCAICHRKRTWFRRISKNI